MSFEAALEARFQDDWAVNTATGGRIIWGRRITALPAMTMQVIADPRPQHFKGFQRVRRTDVQIDAWAQTRDAAIALREAVIAAAVPTAKVGDVQFQRALVNRVWGVAEAEQVAAGARLRGEIFRQSIDFTFIHNA